MNIKYLTGGYGGITAPLTGDAGYDLYADLDIHIPAGQIGLIPTGIAVEIPTGMVGLIKDRSSVAKLGLFTVGGVVDSSYRGEVKVMIWNNSGGHYSIRKGQKISQMVVIPCYTEQVERVNSMSETARGTEGFGSTGDGL